ncbi:unnamed protein product [Sphenostylis stenocarpa]|uniref:Uncharacterized protein n=1 Tax=Sphenostylis stenocarpa TaxID=92480 RepID=A0AA86VJ05_9FABA|nr:unnamed protein product [Sphenostylis stenocarpa]
MIYALDTIKRHHHSTPTASPPLTLPSLSSASPTDAASFAAKIIKFMKSNTHNVATALTQISKTTTIKAFVIDFFCTSAKEPASSMGIPIYYFFTSGAALLALFSYFPKLH